MVPYPVTTSTPSIANIPGAPSTSSFSRIPVDSTQEGEGLVSPCKIRFTCPAVTELFVFLQFDKIKHVFKIKLIIKTAWTYNSNASMVQYSNIIGQIVGRNTDSDWSQHS